jgi:hypothetical protein
MVPFLKSVIQAHVDLGTPIDENTQKLIDQANAAGLLGDDTMSMLDVLKEGFAALIKAVGGEVPDAFKKMAKSAQDAGKDATAAVNGIPKNVDIKVNYDDSGYHPNDSKPTPPPAPATPRVPEFPGDDGRRYATGGVVLPYATGGLVPEVPSYLSGGSVGRVIDFAARGIGHRPGDAHAGRGRAQRGAAEERRRRPAAAGWTGIRHGERPGRCFRRPDRIRRSRKRFAEEIGEAVAHSVSFAHGFDTAARHNTTGLKTTIRRVA